MGGLDVSGGTGGTSNVKLHLTRTVFEGEDWLHLAHNKNQRRDLANTTVNLNAAWKANCYLTSRNTFNLSKMSQLVTVLRHTARGQVEKGNCEGNQQDATI